MDVRVHQQAPTPSRTCLYIHSTHTCWAPMVDGPRSGTSLPDARICVRDVGAAKGRGSAFCSPRWPGDQRVWGRRRGGGRGENPGKSLLSLALLERRWSVDGRRKSEARQGGGWSRSWVLGEVDLDEQLGGRGALCCRRATPGLGVAGGQWGSTPRPASAVPAWGASSERHLMGLCSNSTLPLLARGDAGEATGALVELVEM